MNLKTLTNQPWENFSLSDDSESSEDEGKRALKHSFSFFKVENLSDVVVLVTCIVCGMNLIEKALFGHLQRRHKVEVQESNEIHERKVEVEEINEMKGKISPQVKRVKVESHKPRIKDEKSLKFYEESFKVEIKLTKIKLIKCETGKWTVACN